MKTPSQAKDEGNQDADAERKARNREAAARRMPSSAEGVTTIPKGSTTKRSEAHSPS